MEPKTMTVAELNQAADAAAYLTERDMALDHDHCFLCGVLLTPEIRTDEHVFPRWMQRDFDLWNETLNLLNGTQIRYARLTIPCCRECNGYWLSQVENQVSEAFRSGHDAVGQLPPGILALWMGKIYYGIHFKEVALPADRRDPEGATIVARSELARFSELHHVLQAMRQRVRFQRPCGSVRIYRAQVPEEPTHRFDYRDLKNLPYLAMRVGSTAVIASLLDWGAMVEAVSHPLFEAAEQLDLHPSQFAEVAAFGAYTAGKFNREFGYLIRHEEDHDVLQPVMVLEPGMDPTEPVFDAMNYAEFAPVLSAFTGQRLEDIWDREGRRLWSNLTRGDGSPAVLTLEDAPMGMEVRPPPMK